KVGTRHSSRVKPSDELAPRNPEQHPKAIWSWEMRSTMRYAIVIENAGPNYSAYVPDLPGCVATGGTIEEVERGDS
ncbi:MAG: hypothetical protein UZ18_ATM001001626, partial [Armatimonadetes bacterium OLB18]